MTAPKEYPIDDIAIEPPANSGDDDPIPSGAYPGKLIGFHQEDTPPWKMDDQRKRHPDKEPDPVQWAWCFELVGGDYDGRLMMAYTTRSWHRRAHAAKYAAALLGVADLPVGQGLSTGQLIGRECQLWVNHKEETGKSYLDKVVPLPKRKGAPAKNGATPRAEAAAGNDLEAAFKTVWNDLKALGWSQAELLAACKAVVPDFALFGKLTTPEQEQIVKHLESLGKPESDGEEMPF